jgi:inhibitor of KinA
MFPRLVRLGEETWLVEFEPRLDPILNDKVLAIAEALERTRPAGVFDIVPACASLAVHADADIVDEAALTSRLETLLRESPSTASLSRTHEIPVCYEPSFGLDLDEVSRASDCRVDDVVARHSGAEYRVFMLGFLPGFAYLGIVDERIAVPRRATPRPVVPAGSVGIAGRQTGIYPIESPGGWQIVGRTPVRLFDTAGDRRPVLRPGDRVQFVPIDADRFSRLVSSAETPS